MLQLSVRDLRHIIISQHQLCNPQLLVDPSDHYLLIYRLVRSSDKIAVEIHIQVIHILYMRKWLVHENIIHIECMLRQFQSTLTQQFCSVNNRMHQDILSCHKELNVLPGKHLILRKSSMIIHHLFPLCPFLFIDKVGNQHINGLLTIHKLSQSFQNLLVCLFIDPVITVHNLKKHTCSIFKTCIYRLAMSTIFLMDCTTDPRVSPLIFIGNFRCTILL